MRRSVTLSPLSLVIVASLSLAVLLSAVAPARAAFPGPNGKIVFTSQRDGNSEVYTMNADGSGQTRLTNNVAFDGDAAWSPDGSRIVFDSSRNDPNPVSCTVCNDEIYVMNADGSNQTRVTVNSDDDFDPTWGPNGKIAFSRENNTEIDIYTMYPDGSDSVYLVGTPSESATAPSWSPDGTKIAFTGENPNTADPKHVYVINADGSSPTQLTGAANDNGQPSWSPDGTKLVFQSYFFGSYGISTMNADGSAQTSLTQQRSDQHPVFSPDGAKIAFDESGKIYTMNTDGTQQTLVASNLGNAAPDWQRQPKVNRIVAFNSNRDGNNEIYSMNSDGSGQTRLTNNPASDSDPAISPDGTKIAFVSNRDGNFEIYTMNADGTGQVDRTADPGFDADPNWSRDGQKIAFTSNRSGTNQIYVMAADGTGPTRKTFNAANDGFPAFSPDGRQIVFQSDRDGNENIYRINADGTGETSLTQIGAADFEPSFSADGGEITFVSNRDGNNEIYRMNSNGSVQTRLTSNASDDQLPTYSPDGTLIAFQSNRDGNDEVYTISRTGAGPIDRTANAASDGAPNWGGQRAYYDAPADASPLTVSLVPDYRQTISSSQCSSRSGLPSTHGAPDIPGGTNPDTSCNPPALALGTAAHFGAKASASAQLAVVRGDLTTTANEADVAIAVNATDIRATSKTGADYNPNPGGPDLTLVEKLRITDTYNGGSLSTPATVLDNEFLVPVDCATTADTTIGAACSAATSANAVSPGMIREGKQSVLQVFRVRLRDSGANGVRNDGDDKGFAMQGYYVP